MKPNWVGEGKSYIETMVCLCVHVGKGVGCTIERERELYVFVMHKRKTCDFLCSFINSYMLSVRQPIVCVLTGRDETRDRESIVLNAYVCWYISIYWMKSVDDGWWLCVWKWSDLYAHTMHTTYYTHYWDVVHGGAQCAHTHNTA